MPPQKKTKKKIQTPNHLIKNQFCVAIYGTLHLNINDFLFLLQFSRNGKQQNTVDGRNPKNSAKYITNR